MLLSPSIGTWVDEETTRCGRSTSFQMKLTRSPHGVRALSRSCCCFSGDGNRGATPSQQCQYCRTSTVVPLARSISTINSVAGESFSGCAVIVISFRALGSSAHSHGTSSPCLPMKTPVCGGERGSGGGRDGGRGKSALGRA